MKDLSNLAGINPQPDCFFRPHIDDVMSQTYTPENAVPAEVMRDLRAALQRRGFKFSSEWFGVKDEGAFPATGYETDACIFGTAAAETGTTGQLVEVVLTSRSYSLL
jgi:hypothetical protein